MSVLELYDVTRSCWKRYIGIFGSVAEQKVREKYIGKSVKNFFKKGEANPVKLIKADKTGEIS